MTERETFLETLRAAHEFPTRYEFKLIGANEERLVEAALKVVKSALPEADAEVARRLSRKANHQSLTLTLEVPDPETVHAIYVELRGLDGLHMLL